MGQTKMIKAIVIASLAAVALAEAEADPYLLYGGLGYHGLGYSRYGLGYGLGYGYGHGYVYGKREAEADPYLLYGHGLGYYGHGLGYYGGYYGDSDITARGLLMLRLIPTFFTVVLVTLDTLDTDTLDTMAMDSDTSTARGLLMLSL